MTHKKKPMVFLGSCGCELQFSYFDFSVNQHISLVSNQKALLNIFQRLVELRTDFMNESGMNPQFDDEWFEEPGERLGTNSQVITLLIYLINYRS